MQAHMGYELPTLRSWVQSSTAELRVPKEAQTLWKFVPENYTEKFDALKLILKNNIKEDSPENHTETIPLLFRNG